MKNNIDKIILDCDIMATLLIIILDCDIMATP